MSMYFYNHILEHLSEIESKVTSAIACDEVNHVWQEVFDFRSFFMLDTMYLRTPQESNMKGKILKRSKKRNFPFLQQKKVQNISNKCPSLC